MRRTIVAVMGMIIVLVGIDIVARAAVQSVLARQIQSTEKLQQRPRVTVHGLPFLWQVVSGSYERVETQLEQVPAGNGLHLDSVDVRLTGVHLPLSALLGSGVTQIPVDTVQVRGTATFDALETQVNTEIPGSLGNVRFSYGGPDRLTVEATYTGPGEPVRVSGTAMMSISQEHLVLTLPEESLTQVPKLLRPLMSRVVTRTVPMRELPFGLTPTRVNVTPQGVTVTAAADDVVLRPSLLVRSDRLSGPSLRSFKKDRCRHCPGSGSTFARAAAGLRRGTAPGSPRAPGPPSW